MVKALVFAAAGVLLVAAAAGGTTVAAKWTATLKPGAGSKISGTASLEPAGDNQAKAEIKITGGTPNAEYPWHVHTGSCAKTGGVAGSPTNYPVMKVGKDGTGSASASMPFAAPDSGSYYVNVHKSSSEMGVSVACGDLHKS
ncbi:MAG TPA: hypothetical protein VEI06_02740 [Gemmatimonadaceae bacterium]|nr:hypothetical protein [Gemmatimonadaceae bacterium]